MTPRDAWRLAYRANREARREWRRQMNVWSYRDATRPGELPPQSPPLFQLIDHGSFSGPWETRLARARAEAKKAMAQAAREKPMDPVMERIIRRCGRVPYRASTYRDRCLSDLRAIARSGCAGHGLRLAEMKAAA